MHISAIEARKFFPVLIITAKFEIPASVKISPLESIKIRKQIENFSKKSPNGSSLVKTAHVKEQLLFTYTLLVGLK